MPDSLTAERTVFGLEAPLRFRASHNIEEPGFASKRQAFFMAEGDDPDAAPGMIEFRDLTVLDVAVTRFRMDAPSQDTRKVRVDFDRRLAEPDATAFIQRLADAWTEALAPRQKDPWYGTLYVDVQWSGFKLITERSGGVTDHLQMTSRQAVAVGRAGLEALRWSPLTDIFVEGMKASQPKSKFLFWFVILEELEKRPEFVDFFTPMFTVKEKAELLQAVAQNGAAVRRLNGLLNNPSTTTEGRPAKLLRILQEINVTEVAGLSGAIPIDEVLCKRLIDQRNLVAHKGKAIDRDLLYTVLYPLSQAALAYIVAQPA